MQSPQPSTLETLETQLFADLGGCIIPYKSFALPHAAFMGTMMRNTADQITFGMSLVFHARATLVAIPST